MVRNTISDVNNHLFEQLERLNDPELKGEALQEEINRSKAVSVITGEILKTQRLALDVVATVSEVTTHQVAIPRMLLGGE